ncbi:Mycobacterium rhizamassiliense ORFan, partial [Mycobacterium rhizamassiliense]
VLQRAFTAQLILGKLGIDLALILTRRTALKTPVNVAYAFDSATQNAEFNVN